MGRKRHNKKRKYENKSSGFDKWKNQSPKKDKKYKLTIYGPDNFYGIAEEVIGNRYFCAGDKR